MGDYSVSEAKLQQLNNGINAGGTIPGEVSNALAGTQAALANGDSHSANIYLNQAIEANKKNTPVWESMQAWHDSVKASGTEPEPGPTPVPDDPIPPEPNVYMETTWGDWTRLTSKPPGFAADGFVSVKFTTPKDPNKVMAQPGWVQTGEYEGPPVWREINIATVPGVFSGSEVLVSSNNALTPTVNFPKFAPNTDYYVNVRNITPEGACSCDQNQCNLLVQFHWPQD